MNLSLTRWDPFRTSVFPSFADLDFGLPSRLRDFFRPNLSAWDEGFGSGTWAPPVDIREEADRLVVTAELPGFREDQLSIQMENNVLTISGERKFEREDAHYTRVERSYGRFVRSFVLPTQVDRENVRASFENGLLTIELPKATEARPRQILIGSGKPKEKQKEKKPIAA